jgi:hypothetical protein
MRSKAELFEAHAERCRLLASTASHGEAQRTFLDLAAQWMHLGAVLRELEADRKAVEELRKST